MIINEKFIDETNINNVPAMTRRYYKESLFIRLAALEQKNEALRSERGDIMNYLDRQYLRPISNNNIRTILKLTLSIDDNEQQYTKLERQFYNIPYEL